MTSSAALNCLAGGAFAHLDPRADEYAELRGVTDEIARLTAHRDTANGVVRQDFDSLMWSRLVESGLHRVSSTDGVDAGPIEAAVVLHRLARHRSAVPVAETDVLGAWLTRIAGIEVAHERPLTATVARAECDGDSVVGTATDVPWGRDADVLLVVPIGDAVLVGHVADVPMHEYHNVAGEPRTSFDFALPRDAFVPVESSTVDDLVRRGAWARCIQIVGALDAAADMSTAHVRNRTQFGRRLADFQSVQHSLAHLAGEVERARSASTLAVVAAAEHGFDSVEADYAVTLTKVTLGQVVPTVTRIAHQLHGAIGVTLEHDLWTATMRAHGWLAEFGRTSDHAVRLGTVALEAIAAGGDPWGALFGYDLQQWRRSSAD
jgi:acyl-CoA dehydrogenase